MNVSLNRVWSGWKDKVPLLSAKSCNPSTRKVELGSVPYLWCSMPYLPSNRWVQVKLFLSCPSSPPPPWGEQPLLALARVRPSPAGKRQWVLTPGLWDRTTVSVLPHSVSLPLCRNCHPHSSAEDLVCAPVSLVVSNQLPLCTTPHQQHELFFSSKAKRSYLESTCPTLFFWGSRQWPSIKNLLAAPLSGKIFLLQRGEGIFALWPSSASLITLPCQSYIES